ncbi:MAG: zf-HC2 domain-containing protein [Pseudomonadota bacterium]
MSCKDTIPLLNAYADGELDLMTALKVEAHAAGCEACRARQGDIAAVRTAVADGATRAPATARLRRAVARGLRDAERTAGAGRRRGLRQAIPLAAAAALAMLGLVSLLSGWPPFGPAPERIVYHLNDSRDAATALRNLSNHLEASPATRIVVVAHNAGVDFLLDGASDADGKPFRVAVGELKARGVDFRVCGNTLTRRGITPLKLIPEATLVPSGVAEIARLQTREGFRYLKP